MQTSLTPGSLYSRADLRAIFNIRDATLNTGVFRPAGRDEIWLFVTERKTSDRVQFIDKLEGDTLRWQGQMSGRTDTLVIKHRMRGLKLLVFYRQTKNEHPGAGFRLRASSTMSRMIHRIRTTLFLRGANSHIHLRYTDNTHDFCGVIIHHGAKSSTAQGASLDPWTQVP